MINKSLLLILFFLFFSQTYAIPVVAGYTTYLISFPGIYVLFFTILFVLIFFRWFLIYINWVLLGLIFISVFLLFLIFWVFWINNLKWFVLLWNFIVSASFLFKFIVGFILIAFLFLIVNNKILKIPKLSFFLNLILILILLFVNIFLGFQVYKLYMLNNESNKYIKIFVKNQDICWIYDVRINSWYIKRSFSEFVYGIKFKIDKSKVFDKDLVNLLDKNYYNCSFKIYYWEPRVNYLVNEKKLLIQELGRTWRKINITFWGEVGWYCAYCLEKVIRRDIK